MSSSEAEVEFENDDDFQAWDDNQQVLQQQDDSSSSIEAKLARIEQYLPDLINESTLRQQIIDLTTRPKTFKELSELQIKKDVLKEELERLQSLWVISSLTGEIKVNLDLLEFETVFHSLKKLNDKVLSLNKNEMIIEQVKSKYEGLYGGTLEKLKQVLKDFIVYDDASFEIKQEITFDEINLKFEDIYQIISHYGLFKETKLNLPHLIDSQIITRLTSSDYAIYQDSLTKLSFEKEEDEEFTIPLELQIQSIITALTLIKSLPDHNQIVQYIQSHLIKFIHTKLIKSNVKVILNNDLIKEQFWKLDTFLTEECGLKYHSGEGIKLWLQDSELSKLAVQSSYEVAFEQLRQHVLGYDTFDQLVEREVRVESPEMLEAIEGIEQLNVANEVEDVVNKNSWQDKDEGNWDKWDENKEKTKNRLNPPVSLPSPQKVTTSTSTSTSRTVNANKRRSIVKLDANGDEFEEWTAWDEDDDEIPLDSPVKQKPASPEKPAPRSPSSKEEKSQRERFSMIKADDEEWDAWGQEDEPILDEDEEDIPPTEGTQKPRNIEEEDEEWDAWGEEEDKLDDDESLRVAKDVESQRNQNNRISSKVPQAHHPSEKQTYKSSSLSKHIADVFVKFIEESSAIIQGQETTLQTELVQSLVLSYKLFLQSQNLTAWKIHNELLYLRDFIFSSSTSKDNLGTILNNECEDIIQTEITKLQIQILKVISKDLQNFNPQLISNEAKVIPLIQSLSQSFDQFIKDTTETLPQRESSQLNNTLVSQFYEFLIHVILTTRQQIGADESTHLSNIIQQILSSSFPIGQTLPSQNRLANVKFILESHLKEIMDRFYDGELYDLTTGEILKLLDLLFLDSELKTGYVQEIKELREAEL